MIGLPSSVRIFVAVAPADMRKGFDSLSALVRQLGGDPYSGHLHVFLSRRRDRAKIITFERGGFVLWYRRLERGRFPRLQAEAGTKTLSLDSGQLAMLLDGVDFSQVKRPPFWEPKRAA